MCDIGLKAKSTPQGLKRGLIIQRSDGTNEFVPFPNLLELEFSEAFELVPLQSERRRHFFRLL